MKEIARGKTDVYITFETFSVDNVIVKVNEPLAMAYIEKLHELEQKFDVSSQNTYTAQLILDAVEKGLAQASISK